MNLNFTHDEWTRAEDAESLRYLVACFRFFSNWGEGVRSHFSLQLSKRDARNNDTMYMAVQNENCAWNTLEVDDLILYELPPACARGKNAPAPLGVSVSAHLIHTELHRKLQSRAKCILHLHPPWATALTCTLPGKLEMVHQNCAYFYHCVGYMDYPSVGTETTSEVVDSIVRAFGEHNRVVLQANHGVIVIGETVQAAFDDLYYFEQASKIYLTARGSGLPLRVLDAETCERIARMRDEDRAYYSKLHMDTLIASRMNSKI